MLGGSPPNGATEDFPVVEEDAISLSLDSFYLHAYHSSHVFSCIDGESSSLHQPMEVYVDDETKLTLHGLQQHYVKLQESEKNRKLFDLLDLLEFNQVRSY